MMVSFLSPRTSLPRRALGHCLRHASFGFPSLRRPEDCLRVAHDASARSETLVQQVAAGSSTPTVASLRALDDLSATLCNVLDTMELARNVHPEADFIEAANDAYQVLSARLAEINTDDRLHRSVVAVLEHTHTLELLSTEEHRFAQAMRAEFEHDGADLDAVARGMLRALQAQEASHVEAFLAGCTASDPHGGVWVPSQSLAGALSERVLDSLLSKRGRTRLPADRGALTAALETVDCTATRQELWRAREEHGRGNLQNLHALLDTRHAIAATLGKASYSAHALSYDRIERCPKAVSDALRNLSQLLQPSAKAELSRLRHFRGSAGGYDYLSADPPIDPWDYSFLTAQSRRTATPASSSSDLGLASPYFELEATLRGLQLVLVEAFGLSLSRVPAAEGELWHPTVRKLLLSTVGASSATGEYSDGSALGVLYLDLFPRPRKTNQAGLYTLRSGHHRFTSGGTGRGTESCGRDNPLLHLHLPAAALVCSLPQPRGVGCDPRSGLALLQHSHVEKTLYHEIGHALHALVSRTECQHFSGTRVPLDFVEVPALLMERFASDPRVLRRWAKHHETHQALPSDLATSLRAASTQFTALETQRACLQSLVDLELHGASRLDATASPQRVRDLTAAHTALPVPPHSESDGGVTWHGAFRHLAPYGTGYYTYLWAKSLSLRVWHQCFEAEPLGGEGGKRWCRSVLRHGGARDPKALLNEMLGSGPDTDHGSALQDMGGEQDAKAILQLVSLEGKCQKSSAPD